MADHQSTPPTPLQNIILIGFMGTGKTTLGKKLHQNISHPFIDTDQFIEKNTGRKITDIFAEDGEESFRQLEVQLLESMIEQEMNHHIIATGGGMITTPEAQTLLGKLGFVVWLRAGASDIYERTRHSTHRPLLQCDQPLDAIRELLEKREPLYQQTAHLTINAGDLAMDEIVCGIAESARYYFSNPSDSISD